MSDWVEDRVGGDVDGNIVVSVCTPVAFFELNCEVVVRVRVGNGVGATVSLHITLRFMLHPPLLSVRFADKLVPLCVIANVSVYV